MSCFYGRPKRRRQVSVGVVTAAAEFDADSDLLASGTRIPGSNPGSGMLRVGLMGMDNHIGEGPDLSTANPWRVVQWNPFNEGSDANITAAINTALSLNIWLVAMIANVSASYGGGNNNQNGGPAKTFDFVAYKANVDRMYNIPAFRNNVRCTANPNGIIFLYAGDEPYLETTWGTPSTQPPSQVNANCRYIKNKAGWAGCYTFYRVNAQRLSDGWSGELNRTAAHYDALDYSWLQYEAPYYKIQNRTFLQALAFERTFANPLNLGVACSVNFMNVGPRTGVFDGFTACWDTDNNPGTATGVIIGPGGNPGAFVEGQFVPCASTSSIPTAANILTPPAYCALIAARAATDPDVPFLLHWTEPVGGPGEASLLVSGGYWGRPDYDLQLRQAQLNGEARTVFNGFRPSKP